MSDCRHGGRDVYEAPGYLKNFDTEVGDGRILYKPRKPKWTPTSITFETDANIDFLTAVYVDNGSKCLRFVLAPERDWDTEAGNC